MIFEFYCLPLNQTFAAQKETCYANFIFRYLELLILWTVALKTLKLYAAQVTELNNRKISKRRLVFPARGQS